jgi:hypothetical protein
MHVDVGGIQVSMTEQIGDGFGFDASTIESRCKGVSQSMGAVPSPGKSAASVSAAQSLLDQASGQRPPASAFMADEQLRGFSTWSSSSSVLSHRSQDVLRNRQLSAAIGLCLRYDHMARSPINPVER